MIGIIFGALAEVAVIAWGAFTIYALVTFPGAPFTVYCWLLVDVALAVLLGKVLKVEIQERRRDKELDRMYREMMDK